VTKLIFILTIILLVIPLPFLPLGRDQDIAAYNGMAFARGIWPYLGYYDFNLISQAFINSILYRIFGNSILSIRLFEFTLLCLTLFIIYDLFKNKLKSPSWFLLFFYYVISYMSLGYYNTGQRDCFVLFFLIFALYFLAKKYNNPQNFFNSLAIGIILSVAFFFRWTYIVFLIWFIFLLFLTTKKERIKNIIIFLIGFIIFPLLFLFSYFIKGGQDAIVSIYNNLIVITKVLYPYFGARPFSINVIIQHFEYIFYLIIVNLILIFIFLSEVNKNKIKKIPKLYFIIFLFAVGVQISYAIVTYLQGSFLIYHLLPLQFFSVVTTLTLLDWVIKIKKLNDRYILLIYVLFIVIFLQSKIFIVHGFNIINNYKFVIFKLLKSQVYSPDCYRPPYFCPDVHRELVDVIEKNSSREDYIQLWSKDPGPYFLTNRISPTKFPFSFILWVPDYKYKNKFNYEFLSDLKRYPPKLFIIEDFNRIKKEEFGDLDPYFDHYAELKEFLSTNYIFKEKVKFYDIYTHVE